jgi:hypothetical protein
MLTPGQLADFQAALSIIQASSIEDAAININSLNRKNAPLLNQTSFLLSHAGPDLDTVEDNLSEVILNILNFAEVWHLDLGAGLAAVLKRRNKICYQAVPDNALENNKVD